MRADKKLAAATLASLALFGAQKAVQAKAVMVPFVAIGGGWQTIVSYVADENNTPLSIHIVYNIKAASAAANAACLHYDGNINTSFNDLTSFFIDGSNSAPPPIYPADTIGTTYAPAPGAGSPAHYGYIVAETSSPALTSTLAIDTISFNAGMRFLYAQRSIDLLHSAGVGNVFITTAGTLYQNDTTKFMTFAPGDANPMVYAIGFSTSINILSPSALSVPISLAKTGVPGDYYDRSERRFSDVTQLRGTCVVAVPVCGNLIDDVINCRVGNPFGNSGGWFHLQNTQAAASALTGSSPGLAIVFKVESNPTYGYAVTPLHPLLYTRE